ncbi:MAG: hypothetical protein MUF81_03985 [Verrucomicrobia bacterium]|jgi:hypothetical protein|nr:hypothetical protein [Verrucomicrobiota bacterium]
MNSFGHTVKGRERPARRVTRGALGFNYGPDKGRQVIVSLEAGDLVCFRPKGTRQRHAASVFDLFAYVVRCQALALAREKRQWRKERAR